MTGTLTTANEQAVDTSDGMRDAWDEIAGGYDEFVTRTHMWLANEGLRRAGLRAGMRFLDVAAGSGALSIPAARLGAQVVSTDMSATMLKKLGARARKRDSTWKPVSWMGTPSNWRTTPSMRPAPSLASRYFRTCHVA